MKNSKRLISLFLVLVIFFNILPIDYITAEANNISSDYSSGSTVLNLSDLEDIVDKTDSNGDGLSDQMKKILGLNINEKDTNSDGLTDYFKVYNSLDPLKADTNNDGLSDFLELTEGRIDEIVNQELVIKDTDSDGSPDVFDDDNDGDSLVDGVDISEFSYIDDKESHLVKIITTGEASFITIQIQPSDLDNIYKYNQRMSWPVDNYGQIRNFDGSKGDLSVNPYLEVVMDEYPSERIQEQYGYIFTGDCLLVPLQEIEQDGSYQALQATIYLPPNSGEELDTGKYETKLDLKLRWSLYANIDNINKDWDLSGYIKYQNENIELNDIKYDSKREFIGSAINYQNDNDYPDLTLYYFDYDNHFVPNNNPDKYLSWVNYVTYYDLRYDSEDNSFNASNKKINKTYLSTPLQDLNRYDDPDLLGVSRILSNRFDVKVYDNSINLLKYNWNTDDSVLKFDAFNFKGSYQNVLSDNLSINNNGFYSIKDKYTDEPIEKQSYLRDYSFYYDDKENTSWILYEIFNPSRSKNELILSDFRSRYVNISNELDPDTDSESLYYYLRDLAGGLSLEMADVNKDNKSDFLLTDRTGKMYVISDIYNPGSHQRIHEIPIKMELDKAYHLDTQFLDFNKNGQKDLIAIKANRDEINTSTNLNFELLIKHQIEKSGAFISKENQPFRIVGMQLEEKFGIETTIAYSNNISQMLNLSSIINHLYLNSDSKASDIMDQYQTQVLDETNSTVDLNVRTLFNDHYYEALLDIGDILDNEIPKTNEIIPILITTLEKDSYLNLNELSEASKLNNIRFDITNQSMVVSKQMTLQFYKNGQLLDQYDINEMVENNLTEVADFNINKGEVKEKLAHFNFGVSSIVEVGELITAPLDDYIYINAYTVATMPDALFSSINQLFNIKAPIQTYENVGWRYQSASAKYQNYKKVNTGASSLGHMANIALAIHTGILYGQKMAAVGGTTFGVVTGVSYGMLILASTYLNALLLSIGPVGWVIMGILVVDSIVAFFIEDYNGIVGEAITFVMEIFYDAKQHPGTYLHTFKRTDNEDSNRQVIDTEVYGYSLGSAIERYDEFITRVRAVTKDTPANKREHLEESYATFDINYDSSKVDIEHERIKKLQDVYKYSGYYNHKRIYNIYNKLEFNSPGINIEVIDESKLYHKLIEKVKETRYVVYTTYDYEWDIDSIKNYNSSFYDVIPNELDIFFESFNFVTDGSKISAKKNEIAKIDSDGDGLETYNNQEIDKDGNILSSDPYNYDTDNDGISDYFELQIGSNLDSSDTDNDGLSDQEELKLGTNPNNSDTDNDGISDYIEVKVPNSINITTSKGSITANVYSDPLKEDTDGDGLNDLEEVSLGLNPSSKFTNGQRLYDGNYYDPSLIKNLDDWDIVEGEVVRIDLNEHITDLDGDKLHHFSNIGSIENNQFSYTFDPVNNGKIVEIEIESYDFKNGELKNSFLVYDTSNPFIRSTKAEVDSEIIEGVSVERFDDKFSQNPTFIIEFDQVVNVVSPASITIEAISREELDVDGNNNKLANEVDIEKIDNKTISIVRRDALINDGITYHLNIPKSSIIDNSNNHLEKSYNVKFITEDNIDPKIISITEEVRLDTPLTIDFNEEIKVINPTIKMIEESSNQPVHLKVEKISGSSITVDIVGNILNSNDTYYFYDNNLVTPVDYSLDIADANGNKYQTLFAQLNNELKSFNTGDISGPEIQALPLSVERSSGFTEDGYYKLDYDEEHNQITVPFNKNIYKDEAFESIFVSIENAIYAWDFFGRDFERKTREIIAENNLLSSAKIEGNKLIITLDSIDKLKGRNLSVFIPKNALSCINNLSIYDYWSEIEAKDINNYKTGYIDKYLKVLVHKSSENPPEVISLGALKDTSMFGIMGSIFSSLLEQVNIPSSNVIVPVFSHDVEVSNQVNNIRLYKEGNIEVPIKEIKINNIRLKVFANSGVTIELASPLEEGANYQLVLPQDSFISDHISNEAQTIDFSVKDSGVGLSGVNNMVKEDFSGIFRSDEKIVASTRFEKYINMIGGKIEYQWYRSVNPSQDTLEAIIGANSIVYTPNSEDENQYLFLELNIEYPGMFSHLNVSQLASVLSPPIGPINSAFLDKADLDNIRLIFNQDNYLDNFDKTKNRYDITLEPHVDHLTVEIDYDKSQNNKVYVNGVNYELFSEENESFNIKLSPGDNYIIINSVSENQLINHVYTFKVFRKGFSELSSSISKPEANYVEILNPLDVFVGKTLIGDYQYYDYLNRDEGESIYKWYRQDNEEGDNLEQITTPNDKEYTLTEEDSGKQIYFEVIPKTSSEVTGEARSSWWTKPIIQTNEIDSNLENISIIYDGVNLLNDFRPDQRDYILEFAYKEDVNEVLIQAVGGSNVVVGQEVTNSKIVEIGELLNYQISTQTDQGQVNYYITLDDSPKASSITIEGSDVINLKEEYQGEILDKKEHYQANVLDQYGNEVRLNIDWQIPSDIEHKIEGENNDNIYLTLPSETPTNDLVLIAKGQNTSVQSEKFIEIDSYYFIEYNVSFDTNGGNLVESQSVIREDLINKPNDPNKDGYVFAGWYNDQELLNKFDFNTPVLSDLTLYAKWVLIEECLVEVDLIGGEAEQIVKANGSSINNNASVLVGDSITISINPDSLYRLKEWRLNDEVVDNNTNEYTFTILKDSIVEIILELKPISVTSVTLDLNDVSLYEGDRIQLNASIRPENASNKNILWSTSNPAIASVTQEGLVRAKSRGVTVITVVTEDGSFSDKTNIRVKEKAITKEDSKNSEEVILEDNQVFVEDEENTTILEREELGIKVVEIVSNKDSNKLKVVIQGDYQKELENDEAIISLKSERINLKVPAKEINIKEIANKLEVSSENINDLEIEISINDISEEKEFEIKQKALDQSYELILKPISFEIIARYVDDDENVIKEAIDKFDGFIEREIEIPGGIDPTRVTTAVVYNEDGTFTHVPTIIFERDGVYYAKVKSLTNSIYSVINNNIEVESVENHWAKTPVNSLAKRLIIKDANMFEPSGLITRGAFAEYITKAIGIFRSDYESNQKFIDVTYANEFFKSISIANEYGIISGYPDNTFKPDQTITRQEAMAMFSNVMRVINYYGTDTTRINSFTDKEEVSSWAYQSVKDVLAARLFNGKTIDTIAPLDTITYSEAATALWNLLVEANLINS